MTIDTAQFTTRGVLEGFYGNPWTQEQRLDMLAFLHDHGFNAFVYAPKDDPYHREMWREPYPDEAWQKLAEAAGRASELGIDFCYAISPGLSLCYADDGEVDALLAKCTPIFQLGVPTLGVLLDDIPFDLVHEQDKARYGSLAEAQADFLNRLHRRLQGLRQDIKLVTCPTVYCGDPEVAYLRYLGAQLPEEIDIFWTGPAICSRELTTDYTKRVAGAMQRPPLYWDNYPVNDAGMTAELHIGPYLNRDADLHTVVRGIYANPMELAEASKLPLATVGDYLNDPTNYDSSVSWTKAAEEFVGAELADALATFAESNTVSCLQPGDPPTLVERFRRYLEYVDSFQREQAASVIGEALSGMRIAAAQLGEAKEGSLILQEMGPWLDEYQKWIAMLSEAVTAADKRFRAFESGDAAEAEEAGEAVARARAAVRQGLKDAVDFRTRVCGNAVRNFLQDFLWSTAPE